MYYAPDVSPFDQSEALRFLTCSIIHPAPMQTGLKGVALVKILHIDMDLVMCPTKYY